MVLLVFVTYALVDSERSLVGKVAGGLLVYATSVMDAYRTAVVGDGCSRSASPALSWDAQLGRGYLFGLVVLRQPVRGDIEVPG